MYSRIISYIKQRIEISDEELEEGLKYSTFKKYSKGEYILRIGEYCRFIGFINEGLMVTTTVDDSGKESAFDFKCENCFFTYTEGLTNNEPSHKNFIAIEDCETLILQKEHLEKVLKQNPKFETLFTKNPMASSIWWSLQVGIANWVLNWEIILSPIHCLNKEQSLIVVNPFPSL